ncbi:MAG TPA: hypothetical protein VM692_15200 [Gammaproteobacteria bacterium]|nr:hypothetical protein [Gammaproteobacteria bacterium]
MSERADVVEAVGPSDAPSTAGSALIGARKAYFAITLLILAIVAWGFWGTYYSRLGARGDLPGVVHLHAAAFSLWVLVLVAQASAVAGGRVELHRRLGTAGMFYGGLVFAVGLLVSVGAPAFRVRAGQFPLETGGLVVIYNLTDILLFGAFLALAFAYRNRRDLHTRWIIAATAALCGAALGRVVPGNTPQYLLLWLSPILAMVAVDLVTQRRVHYVPVVSSALLVVAFFKVPLYAAPVWREIGAALLHPFV